MAWPVCGDAMTKPRREIKPEKSPSDFRPDKPLEDPDIKAMRQVGDDYIKSVQSDPDTKQKNFFG